MILFLSFQSQNWFKCKEYIHFVESKPIINFTWGRKQPVVYRYVPINTLLYCKIIWYITWRIICINWQVVAPFSSVIDDGFPILWKVIDSHIEMDWWWKQVAYSNFRMIRDRMRKKIKKKKIRNCYWLYYYYFSSTVFIYKTVDNIKCLIWRLRDRQSFWSKIRDVFKIFK